MKILMSHCVGRMAALSQSETAKFEESKANDKTFVRTSSSFPSNVSHLKRTYFVTIKKM